MKNPLICGLLLTFLLSATACNNKKTTANDTAGSDQAYADSLFMLDTLKGIYIGDFGGSDIRIVLNYISDNHVVGYDLHKGLQRNLTGKLKMQSNTVDMELTEPGDNPYDGVFKVSIDKKTFAMKGSWKPNNSKMATRLFTLKKIESTVDEKPMDSKNVVIDLENFTQYFYEVSDSIGSIKFEDDGLCLYQYYPEQDEVERKEQLVEIRGSWSLKDNHVIIDWKKNTIFPSRQSLFEIIPDEDYGHTLHGEGRELSPAYY
jgi:hypothetical protein